MSKFSVGKLAHKAKHAVKHAAHEAKHTADKATHTVEKTADHATHEVSQGANEAKQAVKQGADAARKGLDEMVDVGHITDEIKHDILKALESAEKSAVSAIENAEKSATSELKHVAEEAKKEVEHELKAIGEAFATKAAHEVLADLVDIIRALSPDDISVQLGPVSLDIGDVESKVEHFVKWAKTPPHNRETYIAFIEDVVPSSLTLVEGIGLGLLIQSDDAKIEITETWNAESILENIDDILERAGIH